MNVMTYLFTDTLTFGGNDIDHFKVFWTISHRETSALLTCVDQAIIHARQLMLYKLSAVL